MRTLAFLSFLLLTACGGPPKPGECKCATGEACVFLSGTDTQVCKPTCSGANACPGATSCGCASSCAFCKDCVQVCL